MDSELSRALAGRGIDSGGHSPANVGSPTDRPLHVSAALSASGGGGGSGSIDDEDNDASNSLLEEEDNALMLDDDAIAAGGTVETSGESYARRLHHRSVVADKRVAVRHVGVATVGGRVVETRIQLETQVDETNRRLREAQADRSRAVADLDRATVEAALLRGQLAGRQRALDILRESLWRDLLHAKQLLTQQTGHNGGSSSPAGRRRSTINGSNTNDEQQLQQQPQQGQGQQGDFTYLDAFKLLENAKDDDDASVGGSQVTHIIRASIEAERQRSRIHYEQHIVELEVEIQRLEARVVRANEMEANVNRLVAAAVDDADRAHSIEKGNLRAEHDVAIQRLHAELTAKLDTREEELATAQLNLREAMRRGSSLRRRSNNSSSRRAGGFASFAKAAGGGGGASFVSNDSDLSATQQQQQQRATSIRFASMDANLVVSADFGTEQGSEGGSGDDSDLDSMEGALADAQQQRDEAEEKAAALEAAHRQLEAALADRDRDLAKLKTAMSQAAMDRAGVKNQLAETESQLSEVTAALTEVNTAKLEVEKELADAQATLDRHDAEAAANETRRLNDALNQSVRSSTGTIGSPDAATTTAMRTAALEAQCQLLQEKTDAAEAHADDLDARLAVASRELDAANKRIDLEFVPVIETHKTLLSALMVLLPAAATVVREELTAAFEGIRVAVTRRPTDPTDQVAIAPARHICAAASALGVTLQHCAAVMMGRHPPSVAMLASLSAAIAAETSGQYPRHSPTLALEQLQSSISEFVPSTTLPSSSSPPLPWSAASAFADSLSHARGEGSAIEVTTLQAVAIAYPMLLGGVAADDRHPMGASQLARSTSPTTSATSRRTSQAPSPTSAATKRRSANNSNSNNNSQPPTAANGVTGDGGFLTDRTERGGSVPSVRVSFEVASDASGGGGGSSPAGLGSSFSPGSPSLPLVPGVDTATQTQASAEAASAAGNAAPSSAATSAAEAAPSAVLSLADVRRRYPELRETAHVASALDGLCTTDRHVVIAAALGRLPRSSIEAVLGDVFGTIAKAKEWLLARPAAVATKKPSAASSTAATTTTVPGMRASVAGMIAPVQELLGDVSLVPDLVADVVACPHEAGRHEALTMLEAVTAALFDRWAPDAAAAAASSSSVKHQRQQQQRQRVSMRPASVSPALFFEKRLGNVIGSPAVAGEEEDTDESTTSLQRFLGLTAEFSAQAAALADAAAALNALPGIIDARSAEARAATNRGVEGRVVEEVSAAASLVTHLRQLMGEQRQRRGSSGDDDDGTRPLSPLRGRVRKAAPGSFGLTPGGAGPDGVSMRGGDNAERRRPMSATGFSSSSLGAATVAPTLDVPDAKQPRHTRPRSAAVSTTSGPRHPQRSASSASTRAPPPPPQSVAFRPSATATTMSLNAARLIKHAASDDVDDHTTLQEALTIERDGKVICPADDHDDDDAAAATLVLGSTILHARSNATTPAVSPAPSRPGTATGHRRDAAAVPVFTGVAETTTTGKQSSTVDPAASAAELFRARGVLEQHVIASAQRVKSTRDRLRDRHDIPSRRTPQQQPGGHDDDEEVVPVAQPAARPTSPTAHILEKTQTDHISQRIAQRRAATQLVSTAAIIERRTGGKKNRSYEAKEHSASGGLDPRRSLAMDRKAQAALPTAPRERAGGPAAGALTNALGMPVVISTSAVPAKRVGAK